MVVLNENGCMFECFPVESDLFLCQHGGCWKFLSFQCRCLLELTGKTPLFGSWCWLFPIMDKHSRVSCLGCLVVV